MCVMLGGVVLLVLRWSALHRHTDRINVRDWLLLPLRLPGFASGTARACSPLPQQRQLCKLTPPSTYIVSFLASLAHSSTSSVLLIIIPSALPGSFCQSCRCLNLSPDSSHLRGRRIVNELRKIVLGFDKKEHIFEGVLRAQI